MEDNRIIRCPGESPFCDECEPKADVKGVVTYPCGYVMTREDRMRLMDDTVNRYSHLSEEEQNAEMLRKEKR